MIAWLRSRLVRWLLPEIRSQVAQEKAVRVQDGAFKAFMAARDYERRTRLPNVRDF
jgi:hypothetical protein